MSKLLAGTIDGVAACIMTTGDGKAYASALFEPNA